MTIPYVTLNTYLPITIKSVTLRSGLRLPDDDEGGRQLAAKLTATSAGSAARLPGPPALCHNGCGRPGRARHGHHQSCCGACVFGEGHDDTCVGDNGTAVAGTALPNRHLTEDEQGASYKFPEVKSDGAMAGVVAESEWAHVYKMIRPSNADGAGRLGINTLTAEVLTEFLLRSSATQFAQASDARYENPTPELDDEAARGMDKLLAGLRVQSGHAPLHTLSRYGSRFGTPPPCPHLEYAPLQSNDEVPSDAIEDDSARAYVGRVVTPVTEAQAIQLGITTEAAANLSDFILHSTSLYWFEPGDLIPNNRHPTDAEQDTTAAFPEVTDDDAGLPALPRTASSPPASRRSRPGRSASRWALRPS